MARNVDIRLRRSAVPGNVPTIEQLNLGELAVNTADGKLYLKRIYDGIEQVIEVGGDAKSGLVSTFNTYIYTSDGTLQNVTGADDYGNFLSYDLASPRRIQVYLNGVLLHQGIDYTATDGSTISFVYPIDENQVVQIAAYNSEGASIDADLILDDGFSFTVGTDEETKLYHNGSNTILKHMAYGDNTFKMMWRDSDRLVMGEDGIQIVGDINTNEKINLSESSLVSETSNTTSTEETVLYTFRHTLYDAAELIVKVEEGGKRHLTKLLITHDNVTPISTEYGTVTTTNELAEFDVSINGDYVQLLGTPVSVNSTTFKIVGTLIK